MPRAALVSFPRYGFSHFFKGRATDKNHSRRTAAFIGSRAKVEQ
jgi:hypothetical protein